VVSAAIDTSLTRTLYEMNQEARRLRYYFVDQPVPSALPKRPHLLDVVHLSRISDPQRPLGRIPFGRLKATFEMPQYPGQKFDATLVATSSAMNETSRSMLVELQADNPDGKLFGGTYCRVDFQIPSDPNMVRLPATALMPVNRGVQVAVLDDSNKVVLKAIQLGRDFGDTVEVTAGLALEDRVIDSPPETLQAGDTVQLAAPTPAPTATRAGAPPSPAAQ
jgi:multidrug efflux pump subunit AcrA (membrane-fusion protein)